MWWGWVGGLGDKWAFHVCQFGSREKVMLGLVRCGWCWFEVSWRDLLRVDHYKVAYVGDVVGGGGVMRWY